jgi:hypothetical protein
MTVEDGDGSTVQIVVEGGPRFALPRALLEAARVRDEREAAAARAAIGDADAGAAGDGAVGTYWLAGHTLDRYRVAADEAGHAPVRAEDRDDVGGFGSNGYFLLCDTSRAVVTCKIIKVSADVYRPGPRLFP